MAAKHIHEEKFEAPVAELFQKVQESLNDCEYKITSVNEEERFVWSKIGMNMATWGEDVYVKVKDDGTVYVKSEASMPMQLFDWGKNKRNVRKFMDALKSRV